MSTILDGKSLAKKLQNSLESRVKQLSIKPRLDIIIVGDDYGSKLYVSMKKKMAEQLGISCVVHEFGEDTPEIEVINRIKTINADVTVHGLMVQLPLPSNFNEMAVINAINYSKDVDGLSALNLGLIFQSSSPHSADSDAENSFLPATVLGIERLLNEYNIDVAGKETCIIGCSAVVGIPLAGLLLRKNATVTMCHSKTQDIKNISSRADIVVSATGIPKLVKTDWIKEGAVVIDVGTAKDPETGKLCGDVDFEEVEPKVSFITPVPGGVGPMTVISLMENVVSAGSRQ